MMYYIDGREVDIHSAVIEDVDTKDYPDFCDAFISEAYFLDGGALSEAETERLEADYPGLTLELATESLH